MQIGVGVGIVLGSKKLRFVVIRKKITTNSIKVRTDGQGGTEKNYTILRVQYRL